MTLLNVVSLNDWTYFESARIAGHPAQHAGIDGAGKTLCGIKPQGQWIFNWGKPFELDMVDCKRCKKALAKMTND